MTPTEEQQAIVDAVKRSDTSIMIRAMAGCAKTTTLELVARAMPVRPSLATAFNVKIKKEMETRLPQHFQVKTLNGLGHEAWGRTIGKRCSVDDKKVGKIVKQVLDQNRAQLGETTSEDFTTLLSLVRRARTVGLVPSQWQRPNVRPLLPDDDSGWEAVGDSLYADLTDTHIYATRLVLNETIRLSYEGVIDFDDQIYMSALFGGVFARYPIVLVDEAQDLSPLNHIQVEKSAAQRLIVVGDPRQAIYAFRGADSSSMDNLRSLRQDWIDLPLSLTFRCPKTIVARQQSHAPGFTAHETNAEGLLHLWTEREKWTIADIETLGSGQIAILCRNNAPLMATALRIIKSGRGCTILGREIGKSLIALSSKIMPQDIGTPADCAERINRWAEKEIALARANGKEEKVAIIEDKADCLQAVVSSLDDDERRAPARLRKLLETIFSSDSMRITLATGHKAKGLEWPIVLHLDPFRVPSKYARRALEEGNPIPFEQDMNLKYVIETRSKHDLILANLEQMEAV